MKASRPGPSFDQLPDSALVRLADFSPHLVPLSPATIWRRVREGTFPTPLKLSNRATAWRVGDLRRWMVELEAS